MGNGRPKCSNYRVHHRPCPDDTARTTGCNWKHTAIDAHGDTRGPPPGLPSKFLGIGIALKCLGHVMYDPAMLEAELSLKRDIQGNITQQAAFRDFAVNYMQLRVYWQCWGIRKW
jgi:hypothetical protein